MNLHLLTYKYQTNPICKACYKWSINQMANPSPDQQLHIFFFPFLAHGHILPMANLARLFAEHGVSSTIVTTPANANLIDPYIKCNGSIKLLLLPFPSPEETGLPMGCENTASLPHPHHLHTPSLFKAIDLLKQPFADRLQQHQPDYLISDWVYTWTTDLSQSQGIPRLVFQTCSAFSNAICKLVNKHKPHLDDNPFQVPAASRMIPHRIQLMRAQLPAVFDHPYAMDQLIDAEKKSYGTVMNSFYELEPWYMDFLRDTKKLCCVGPVALGNNSYQVDDEIMRWLDGKDAASVIYICFGSESNPVREQILEMASGLESSGYPFLWVLRGEENILLPDRFEKNVEGKGLIIRGWEAQAKILNHPAVGGFMTHCGWNSILEGVSAGLPMASWPITADQFINEKLVVEVLSIAMKVMKEEGSLVDKETIKNSMELLMGRGGESSERRKRAKEYELKAQAAVQKGGTSSEDLVQLIEKMRANSMEKVSNRR